MSDNNEHIRFIRNIMKRQRSLTRITPVKDKSVIPLTYAQQRLWFIQQLNMNNIAYNMFTPFRVSGKIDINAFNKAINAVIKRYEILRTIFVVEEGIPVQKVLDELVIHTEQKDFTQLLDNNKEIAFKWIIDQTKVPFDLSKGPLVKCFLAQIDEENDYLLLLLHHIIADGWSMNILYKELEEYYNGFIENREVVFDKPKIQYSDYAIWLQNNYKKENLEESMKYWIQKIPKDIEPLKLPLDFKRPSGVTYEGKLERIIIPEDTLKRLKDLRKLDESVSLYMIIVASFRCFLYLYSGQKDIIIGSALANRNRVEIKNLIGYFANMVGLYTKLEGDDSFLELLLREKETCIESYENQDVPFEYIIDELKIKRELSRNPLFQAAITYQNVAKDSAHFGKSKAEIVDIQRDASMFDILLMMYNRNSSLDGWVEYSTALFSKETIQRFVKQYIYLIDIVSRNPNIKLNEISLNSIDEYNKIIYEWNKTEKEYSGNLCLHQLFEKKVLTNRDNIAVSFQGKVLTYGQLNKKANQMARFIQKQASYQKGACIGICMERGFEMIVGLLAIEKLGCTYVPIDPKYPIDRICYITEDCNIKFIITQEKFLNKLQVMKQDLFAVDHRTAEYEKESGENLNETTCSSQLAYIIYTSGTTGTPKGVQIAHKTVINLIEWVNTSFHVSQSDRLLFVTSVCFDLSVYDIFGILAAGGCIVIPEQEQLSRPEEIIEIIDKEKITFWDSAPATLVQLANLFHLKEKPKNSSLRLVFLSGDWIPVDLPERITGRYDNAKVISLGGATEATIWSNFYPIETVDTHWKSIPYGKPISNAKYYILNEKLIPCPIGVEGDLYIGGDCLALGYQNKEELTKEKFIDNPYEENKKMYATGDRARFYPDGNIEFIGRKDSQVKIRGYRIELDEIKTVLYNYEHIKSAVVIAKEIRKNDKEIVAFVVLDRELSVLERELKEYLASKLPTYMIPTLFVQLEKLPMTDNGKLDTKQLENLDIVMNLEDKVNPETKMEEDILRIWIEILGNDNIGVETNFFEAGGHSLLVTQVIVKIQEELNLEVSVKDVFIAPTVRSLVQLILGNTVQKDTSEMLQDTVLDVELATEEVAAEIVKNVLLTGCTGFIGRFLLYELLTATDYTVYCMLRGQSKEQARQRLIQMMQHNQLWDEAFTSKIEVVQGDLTKENFGLSDEEFMELAKKIDVIYNNGAVANYLGHYDTLKVPNVYGTRQIIKLAATYKIKPIHHSSTLTIFNADAYRSITEDTTIDEEQHEYFPGYFASKWVAEKLIQQARELGITCNIYRFGLMTGDTKLGRYDQNQWMYQMLKGFIMLGYGFNKMPDFNHAVMPIDIAVKTVVGLSKCEDLNNQNFFICNPNRIPVQNLIEVYNKYAKKPVEIIDFFDWMRKAEEYISEGNQLIIYYFVQHLAGFTREEISEYINDKVRMLNIQSEKTQNAMQKNGIDMPILNESLIKTYLEYIIQDDDDLQEKAKAGNGLWK